MKTRIIALLIALLGATTGALAQDDISLGYVIGNGRLLGAKTFDGQTTVGVLGIDSSGNTIIKSLSGSDVLFPSNLKIANNTYIQARNAAGSADIDLIKVDANDDTIINSDASDPIKLQIASDANRLFTFDASSDTAHTITFGDAGVTATQNLTIRPSTADGDDDAYVCLASGSACSRNGGAYIIANGNELASVGGDLELSTGAGAGDVMYFYQAANAEMTIAASDTTIPTNNLVVTAGNVSTGGTVTSSRATDLGWSAVNAANQACNTTCTSACVFGMNTGALGDFVGCADATADTCICAGAS